MSLKLRLLLEHDQKCVTIVYEVEKHYKNSYPLKNPMDQNLKCTPNALMDRSPIGAIIDEEFLISSLELKDGATVIT